MVWRDWFKKKKSLEDYLSRAEQDRIVEAIRSAEGRTSGELRIHLEPNCPGDALEHATAVFNHLQMHNTALRNAVFIYCAVEDRKFALLGDSGIHERVGETYWRDLASRVQEEIHNNSLAAGLCLAAETIGESLSQHFPRAKDDRDELPDTISFEQQ